MDTPAHKISSFPYVGIIQIRSRGSKRFSLLSACFLRKLPVFYSVRLQETDLFSCVLCLNIKISKVDVKHFHLLHRRYQYRCNDRPAAA